VANGPQGKRPDWWPREPAGYVFLARAVEKIGSALHGNDWTGEEATAEEIEPLPCSLKEASPYNRRQAEDLLQRHRPDLGRPAVIGWNEFSEEDWKIAYELEQRLRPALKRLQATQSEIVKTNEIGELELSIQSRSGGPWRDFNKDWWNTDKWRSHFDRCRIDPEYPNGDRPSWSKEDDHWIFATSRSVERLLNQLAGTQPDQKPAALKISAPTIADFVKRYFDSTSHPTMDGLEAAWKNAKHGSSARTALRKKYRELAKERSIDVKRGPRQNSAK
jgi:hypothetical protein